VREIAIYLSVRDDMLEDLRYSPSLSAAEVDGRASHDGRRRET
jgi:hypothetical protein